MAHHRGLHKRDLVDGVVLGLLGHLRLRSELLAFLDVLLVPPHYEVLVSDLLSGDLLLRWPEILLQVLNRVPIFITVRSKMNQLFGDLV